MRRLLYSSLPTTVSPHWINEDVESRLKFCGIRLPRSKDMGIYISGVLFATGWWAFIDAMIYSKVITGSQILTVKDWISGVLSTLGIVVVNSINKSCLTEIEYLHSNSCLSLWQARLTLFLGFVFMASGVCWSAVNEFRYELYFTASSNANMVLWDGDVDAEYFNNAQHYSSLVVSQ
ncbi:4613_t:CDS:2 [Ambispora gerdemannii]|uniref:4613_t:CDS:1 n=1 Tax=Ambispora gerdemannii TaxID=144530 RepID=A0A9N9DAZ3_9GLOM|nr:4613_t:CDS:2 [Ambispora gerdemannii]